MLNWYQKPTFSGRYLNYFSHHPHQQKMVVIFGIIDRATLLSYPNFHKKNLIKPIHILLSNDYSLDLIFKTVNRRLHYLFDNNLNLVSGGIVSSETCSDDGENFFTVSFLPGVTDSISRSLKTLNFKLSYRNLNTLNCFIRVNKRGQTCSDI